MDRGNSLPSIQAGAVDDVSEDQQHLNRLREGKFILLLILHPFLRGKDAMLANICSKLPGNTLDATSSLWMTALTRHPKTLISPVTDRPNLGTFLPQPTTCRHQRPFKLSVKRRSALGCTQLRATDPLTQRMLQTATAVAHAKEGRGLIRINGSPINLVQPEILRFKIYEPILVAGEESFAPLDIRVRVKGGGHTSQVYAIRQAIAKAVVAYYSKYIDAYSAMELKKKLVAYDRTLLIADPRRMEPKKFGGAGARARRQKRYVYTMRFQLVC